MVTVRDLIWADFPGWVELYYSRFEEIQHNPDLGVFLRDRKPSLSEEAAVFTDVYRRVLGGTAVVCVAVLGDRLVGLASVHPKGNHVEDRHVGVLAIAVHPDHRQRGVGTALMDRALEGCRGKFEIVQLTVLATNERALRLYRRCGFEASGTLPRSFKRGGRYFDEVVMWRAIGPAAEARAPGPPITRSETA
ncbi:MAG TPA: GNAT family N-acetyltransferase [Thermoplasmata archaeon]|nr:GNAT family N-acetyltransferase [Thermoplasmata archaeon]